MTLTNKTLSEPYLLEEFGKLPLPVRMRAAADVLVVVNDRVRTVSYGTWSASTLIKMADEWEAEDVKDAEAVDELASAIYNNTEAEGVTLHESRFIARSLIDAGWKKGAK